MPDIPTHIKNVFAAFNLGRQIRPKQSIAGVPTQSYKLTSVFKTKDADLTFIPRQDQKWLESYMQEPGRPICLEGPLQAGKTNLAHIVSARVFPNKPLHVVCDNSTTVEAIVKKAFQELAPLYETEVVKDESEIQKQTRPQPEPISSVLATFAAQAGRPLIVDDAHKLNDNERQKLAYFVREWQTLITDNPPKIVVVATDSARGSMGRSLLRGAPDLQMRLVTLHLPRMTPDELREIIRRGGKLMNVDFSQVEDDIVEDSGGLSSDRPGRPLYTQDICTHACTAAGITKTEATLRLITRSEFEEGRDKWLAACGEYVKIRFEEFFAHPPSSTPVGFCKQVCSVLAERGLEGMPFSILADRLAEEFTVLPEVSRTALFDMIKVDVEENLIEIDSMTQQVRFAEPHYLTYYKKSGDQRLDHYAARNLSRQLRAAFERAKDAEDHYGAQGDIV
jgi:hypothetical protein